MLPLSQESLLRLRESLGALRDHDGGAIPHADLVRLASAAEQGCGIAIDVAASELLGAPLVVLQPEARDAKWMTELTPREREIACLVAHGLANKEIAVRLAITTGTVKDHVHRILSKTGLPNRAAIAAGTRVDR